MLVGDVGIVQVEAGLLYGAVVVDLQVLRMASEEVRIPENYEGCGAGSAHSAEALAHLFSCWREPAVDAEVQVRHVYSDLEGGGGDHSAEVPGPDFVLDLAAFLGQITGPVGHDLVGTAGHAGDAFGALAGVVEQDCLGLGVVVDDGCEQPGRCRFRVFLVLGVGHMEQQSGVCGCSVLVYIDLGEGPAGEVFHVFFRGSDGRGGGDVLDEIPVLGVGCGSVQAAKHEGGVGPEHVFVDVCLVGDRHPEVGQKPFLGGSAGSPDEPCVDHVGGHEGHFCSVQDGFALAHGRVAGDLLDDLRVHFCCGCCRLPAD